MRRLMILPLLLAAPAFAGSDTPPPGPPWVRELAAAQKDALARNVPIFVYLTKTH
jgi:hypothetical protein